MTPAYLAAIEQAFLTASGRGLMLSARDLQIVRRWSRAGLPEEVVVRAIEEAFDPPPARRVMGLSYVVPLVDRAAQAWRERQVGAGLAAAESAPAAAPLPGLIRRLEQAQAAALAAPAPAVLSHALEVVRGWSSSLDEEALDAELATLRAGAIVGQMALVDREASFRPAEELEATAAEMRWRAIREHLGLPDLSLDSGGW